PAVRQLPGFPLALLLPCLLVAACGHEDRKPVVAARQPRVSPRSVRITMDALHQLGGVPAGWQLTPLPGDAEAGRQTFQDLGCPSCHRIAGEPFAGQATRGPGPDLTGNGAHPPPAGLPASSSNPDAVLADGPGYVSRDGHSAMPAYPDLTVTQLEDLVAYLSSLTSGDPHAGHMMAAAGVSSVDNRPTPPETQAKSFFVQTYDVQPGKVKDFEDWFTREGAKKFMAVDGLVGIDTFVDGTRPTQTVTTVFSFRDDAALNAFMTAHDPGSVAVGSEFDSFVGPHDHRIFR